MLLKRQDIFPQEEICFHLNNCEHYFPHLHSHDFYEIFVILEGRCFHCFNGKEELLPAGSAMLISPKDLHRLCIEKDCLALNIAFSVELMQKVSSLLCLDCSTDSQIHLHCACTVPMAISLEGIRNIIRAAQETGKTYMMMETSIYTTHFFHVKEMKEAGEFGKVQLVRGAHYQGMENWPSYWMGLPPMYYGTHAIAPMVMASGKKISRVHCFGSGVMDEKLHQQYGNPYPIETAIFDFQDGLKGEATRSLFNTARQYTESFHIYGEKKTFEWQQLESDENPVIFTRLPKEPDDTGRGVPVKAERFVPRNRDDLLPKEIRRFTIKSKYYDETNPQITFEEGGGHGGSHPHMVHEFIRSILEKRQPWLDMYTAANITASGICAHTSAMQDGAEVTVPDFAEGE